MEKNTFIPQNEFWQNEVDLNGTFTFLFFLTAVI